MGSSDHSGSRMSTTRACVPVSDRANVAYSRAFVRSMADDAAATVQDVAGDRFQQHALACPELGDHPERTRGVGADVAVQIDQDRSVAPGGDVVAETDATVIEEAADDRETRGELPAGRDLREIPDRSSRSGFLAASPTTVPPVPSEWRP